MQYKILTGNYETGTHEQQAAFNQLFGKEGTKEKFDLYFHWFNIIHELGHCLVDMQSIKMKPAEEELYVNCFAIQYWKVVDCSKLMRIQVLINQIINKMPVLLPDGLDFCTYFDSIWSTEQMKSVKMYGYFQLRCVQQAFEEVISLKELLKRIGLSIIDTSPLKTYMTNSECMSPSTVLQTALYNLRSIGCKTPEIEIIQISNPEVQCCQSI